MGRNACSGLSVGTGVKALKLAEKSLPSSQASERACACLGGIVE
jgi:hypothetical protein